MDSRDDNEREPRREPDLPRNEAGPTELRSRPDRPGTIATDDPVINPNTSTNSDWVSRPDRTAVIETSRIQGPGPAGTPTYIPVPVEPYGPERHRSGGTTNDDDRTSQNGHEDDRDQRTGAEGHGDQRSGQRSAHAAKGPSLTRVLLLSAGVALVCGVLGAWGYSHFAGSKHSDDKQSSNTDSNSNETSDSGKDSESEKSADGSGRGKDASKLLQAQSAWMTAIKELQQSRAAEQSARRSEEDARAVINFLKETLLSSGRPGERSLTEAFWAGGQGKDVTLSKALDMTESRVAEAFADRPLAEAQVREMLGLAYLNLGDAARAVKQYERALALREAVQGANDSDTAACRNQLAVAYRLAGRAEEGSRLFDRSPDTRAHAAALSVRGALLLAQKQPADAELKLRECLRIREQVQPDDWTTFDTMSMLGEALLDQNKLADAEPLLVSGYEGMKQRASQIPPQDKARLLKALDRLVRLYEALGRPEKAMRWRQERESMGALKKQ